MTGTEWGTLIIFIGALAVLAYSAIKEKRQDDQKKKIRQYTSKHEDFRK
jgi:hypothetical protein